jgi:2-C-methyl-D-erythritol 4-phosphate cytidylyltransferase
MATSIRYWAIIPAAGCSQRMGATLPKQYLQLANYAGKSLSILEASLDCFLRHPKIMGVVVALHADDQNWADLVLSSNDKIYTVIGGESRAESVHNAVKYLDNIDTEDNDFVLVHDAARPCLRFQDLDFLIQQLAQDEVGGILASPVSDTLKIVEKQANSENTVRKTLDRANVWRALTPQMFRLGILKKALAHCAEQTITITDEASAVEALGLRVKLVAGHADNIKVTQMEDLALAAAIYKNIN